MLERMLQGDAIRHHTGARQNSVEMSLDDRAIHSAANSHVVGIQDHEPPRFRGKNWFTAGNRFKPWFRRLKAVEDQ